MTVGSNYLVPGVYTETRFDNPVQGGLDSIKIPVIIGEGEETLFQGDFEIARGSSSLADQRVVKEDMTGRAVVSVSATNVVTLGAFDGVLRRIQARNYPLVTGDGTGTTTTRRSDVSVTVNGTPVVVLSVNGALGIVELVQAPVLGDEVRLTYFFNRTDTLITDDVSEQVTDENAYVDAVLGLADVDAPASTSAVLDLHGDILNSSGQVVVPANNVLNLTVDGEDYTITFPARPDYTIAQIAAVINASNAGSLVASRLTNNEGLSQLRLVSDQDLTVNDGSANALLGFVSGTTSVRVRTFYVFQGPIVDGSNGGVTTTDPAKVTVKVDNVTVAASAVDGVNRAVTLPFAPASGSTVKITYYFNTWQDTFDYLAHINVTDISRVGDVPGSSSYIEDADFVLRDDRIHWGTSSQVVSGDHTTGAERFDETQITSLLIDDKTFLSLCTPVADTTTSNSATSRRQFQLPFDPTLGNGRDTSLSQATFNAVANNRIDLATTRPDLIQAYVGYDVQDALNSGAQIIQKVEGNVITLVESVPAGAQVYATFWYNRITDGEYLVTSTLDGASGVGTYTIQDSEGDAVFGASYNPASKGAALVGIALNFPSGSELAPDLRFEGVGGDDFTGPLAETVTVQFESREATPAKYSSPGAGPYAIINDESDRANIYVDGAVLSNVGAGDAGLDLGNPTGHSNGFFASLVGDEIEYTGGSGAVVGESYTLDSTELLLLTVDDALFNVLVPTGTGVTGSHFVDAINEVAGGHQSTAAGGGASTITLNAAVRSSLDDYYNGWVVVVGDGLAADEFFEVADYVGSTGVATIDGAWVGGNPALGDNYYIYNPETQSQLKGAARFDGPFTVSAGEYDEIAFAYVGTGVTASLTATLTPGAYATVADLATEVETQINAELVTEIGGTPALAGARVYVTADPDGRLQFRLQLAGQDSAGYFTFITGGSLAVDFAIVAGLDTAATAAGIQAKLLQGPIARLFTPSTVVTKLFHDRIVLRNRILPGQGSTVDYRSFVDQQVVEVENGSGNTKAGFTAGLYGEGGARASVTPASLVGHVGFAGGQSSAFADARDGQPVVIFYDGTGANPANNVFRFTLDGVACTVTFTASAGGTTTALGPITVGDSVLDQIVQALAALPGLPFGNAANIRDTLRLVRQEGAGIRLTSRLSSVSSSVVVGSGSSNAVLGFSSGQTSSRSLVTTRKLASAFNDNRHSSFATQMHSYSTFTANYFATDALAWVSADTLGREYLYLQSRVLGSTSAIQWRQAVVGSTQTDDVLFLGTGLYIPNLDGATGEPALQGFFVTSSEPSGSGSINTSILNDGTGQDGVVGQTYRDEVTGLTFTILPRGFQDNPSGPWIAYPVGAAATFRIVVSDVYTTNANLPHRAIPGVELTVANTLGVPAGDNAVFSTFKANGNEPAIGDLYYVSYFYQKESFDPGIFTKLSAIVNAYGSIDSEHPVSLASALAYLNGAVLIAVKQVPKAEDSLQGSLASYQAAIDQLEGPLPGQLSPDILVPLKGDDINFFQYVKRSVVKMSSLRYRSERTAIVGTAGGTLPETAGAWAQALAETRMRLVYPDIVSLTTTDALGVSTEALVDGFYPAAALAGSVCSPNVDVATPWTNRKLVGFNSFGRVLNPVQKDQLAVQGVLVLEDQVPFLRVRDERTTNVTNVLTRLPTIIMIADEVQRRTRSALDVFIGAKQIPGLTAQIEGRFATVLKALQRQQIISAYTGVTAQVSPTDPTTIECSAFYAPIFPVLYIRVTFNLRTSL